eukprot:c19619_g1_i1.p2 GENE.c19619_g1_i1~~c19619_g1_i1.p2  ORF type:complete len:228 (+),score=48.82 c19619_g1_i1:1145-1828(+)
MVRKNHITGVVQRLRRTQQLINAQLEPHPSYWETTATPDPSGVFSLHSLPATHSEYQRVTAAFHKTVDSQKYKILSIQVYQNPTLWTQYQLCKQAMDKLIPPPGANEKFVFHGTQEKFVSNICINGFLRDFNSVSYYGKGTYFARDAQYSVSYSPAGANGISTMFFVRILIGESCLGTKDKPQPDKKASGAMFDSMVNNMADPSIYVLSVGSDHRAYPDFVIQFKPA